MKKAHGEIKRGQFIIGSIHKTTGAFSIASNPAVKMDEASARREAERLAQTDRSKKFVVWRCQGVVASSDVVWSA